MIVNRSNLVIDKPTKTLLTKGLTFVPDKKKENISEILNDFGNWGRRLKLRAHFGGKKSSASKTTNSSNIDNRKTAFVKGDPLKTV